MLCRGKKLKKIGYAANFCAVCRGIMPFEISLVKDKKKGIKDYHIKKCNKCATISFTDFEKYEGTQKKLENVEGLISKTYPHLRERFRPRLVIEKNLKENPKKVTKAEHQQLIDETFSVFMPIIKDIYSQPLYIDKSALRWILIGIIIPITLMSLAIFMKVLLPLWLGLGIFIISGILSFFFMTTSNDRYFHKKVLPKFAKCLSVVHPSMNELNDILDAYWDSGIDIASKIDTESLMQEIAGHVCKQSGTW